MNEDPMLSYNQSRIEHYDRIAGNESTLRRFGHNYYHRRKQQVLQLYIPPGTRVLELGCGNGATLAALKPSYGVGIDFSSRNLGQARELHPELTFIEADVHCFALDATFDFIIASDLVNDLWDVRQVFQQLAPLCHARTRIFIDFYSRVWELPLRLARRLGLATPVLTQNWLTCEDVENLLELVNLEPLSRWQEILLPFNVPVAEPFFNRFLVKLWPFNLLALNNFIMARRQPEKMAVEEVSVSILIPARNEAGNIENIFARTPDIGRKTELIFVEGNSSDNTYEAIEAAIQAHPERCCKLFRQPGRGKGDAVRHGFARAEGDILVILDADLTVPPEELPRFVQALCDGKGDFINGVRLVYPMADKAMRFCNFLGNKFFSFAFSWLLGQPIKDTLCGTKVLWRTDYERICAGRAYFGDFDPFGDFDLIFGAVKQNLKIVDFPIRYRERSYGDTNINRWRHGLILLRMTLFAAFKLKFK